MSFMIVVGYRLGMASSQRARAANTMGKPDVVGSPRWLIHYPILRGTTEKNPQLGKC
jgi:hypothetical protein